MLVAGYKFGAEEEGSKQATVFSNEAEIGAT